MRASEEKGDDEQRVRTLQSQVAERACAQGGRAASCVHAETGDSTMANLNFRDSLTIEPTSVARSHPAYTIGANRKDCHCNATGWGRRR